MVCWVTRRYIGLLVHYEYVRWEAVWKSMHWDDEYYSEGPGVVCGHQTVYVSPESFQ